MGGIVPGALPASTNASIAPEPCRPWSDQTPLILSPNFCSREAITDLPFAGLQSVYCPTHTPPSRPHDYVALTSEFFNHPLRTHVAVDTVGRGDEADEIVAGD